MNGRTKSLLCTLLILAVWVTPVLSADYKASLAQMPVYAESADKGVLVDLVKAMAEESGKGIDITVGPFKRSLHNVTVGKADFHMPLIQNPLLKLGDLTYSYSTETIFHVNFVLYTNKSKTLDRSNLAKYKIETDAAHVLYFHKGILPSTNLESSLKKVNAGRIDGFIFADFASDPVIKGAGLKNIKRELYNRYDVKIILPKGGTNGPTDKFLTSVIGKLRASGKYGEIMNMIDAPYDDWQP